MEHSREQARQRRAVKGDDEMDTTAFIQAAQQFCALTKSLSAIVEKLGGAEDKALTVGSVRKGSSGEQDF